MRMYPDQLQWVLDHNMQIRGGHRAAIAGAVTAWREDRASRDELLAALKALLEWSTSEYQSNPRIDARARAAIARAEGYPPPGDRVGEAAEGMA